MKNGSPTWLKVAALIAGIWMTADALWRHNGAVAFPWAVIVITNITSLLD